ncbi:MAG: hypothetical protein Q7R65_04500 [bacterium]|nr:hypothetical protein [bacterium]
MSKGIQFEVDMTLCLYQDRESWLNAVHEKYGQFGERMAMRCAAIVGLEVETMDKVEKILGKTVAEVLKQAEEAIGFRSG